LFWHSLAPSISISNAPFVAWVKAGQQQGTQPLIGEFLLHRRRTLSFRGDIDSPTGKSEKPVLSSKFAENEHAQRLLN
jgi:hypothetical protein